jgi:hypothetical protein
LSFLLAKKHIDPVTAIQEINQLSTLQVNALIKLYDNGLRGEHLRQWQHEARLHFSEENLEKLLRSSLYEKRDPVAALKEIAGSKPMAIPVRYT